MRLLERFSLFARCYSFQMEVLIEDLRKRNVDVTSILEEISTGYSVVVISQIFIIHINGRSV